MKIGNFPQARRRFTQFSLSRFLFVTVFTGIFGGGALSSSVAIYLNWKTVAHIERQGVRVRSDFEDRYGLYPPKRQGTLAPLFEWSTSRPDEIDLSLMGNHSADEILQRMTALSHVRSVNLCRTNVTRRGLMQLRNVTGLQELTLGATSIDNDALELLVELPTLKRLNLSDTQISDEGVASLIKMPWLEDVTLIGTRITHGGLVALREACPNTKFRHHSGRRQRMASTQGPRRKAANREHRRVT